MDVYEKPTGMSTWLLGFVILRELLMTVEGRITVIHIGESRTMHRFRQATHNWPNLQVFSVVGGQDIPHIVLEPRQS